MLIESSALLTPLESVASHWYNSLNMSLLSTVASYIYLQYLLKVNIDLTICVK